MNKEQIYALFRKKAEENKQYFDFEKGYVTTNS